MTTYIWYDTEAKYILSDRLGIVSIVIMQEKVLPKYNKIITMLCFYPIPYPTLPNHVIKKDLKLQQ